jgi:hypothetical protein
MKTPTEVALQGFRFLAEGHKAGSFQNYLDLLTDDYFFFAPVGEYRGENKGKERATKFYQAITDAKADFIFSEPLRVTANGNTVVIEFTDQGTLMGNRYFNASLLRLIYVERKFVAIANTLVTLMLPHWPE